MSDGEGGRGREDRRRKEAINGREEIEVAACNGGAGDGGMRSCVGR